MNTEPNRLLADRYRLIGELGRGEVGVVWQAHDEALGRPVAVKEIRAAQELTPAEVRLLYTRLEREAMTAGRISHRNVATVHNVVVEDGRLWIVMELVRGPSLGALLEAKGALPPARTARIGAEAMSALRSAHDAGITHRDLRPSNLLLEDGGSSGGEGLGEGRVVLTDFGIALVKAGTALTRDGEPVGAPEFLAPECARGEPHGPAADLWSLGVLLYLAVEGVSPFRRDTPEESLRAVAGYTDGDLPPLRWAGPLAPVLAGLLREDPGERMSAAEAERLLRVAAAGSGLRATGPDGSSSVLPSGSRASAPSVPSPEPVLPGAA
ncbi:MAG TPA: serine/threonine-protein kinase, partial [Streptomyces sp.]|nr:serine/threonine-protein kinase [Streptomyces sp.]